MTSGVVPLFLLYGQSWLAGNGNNGRMPGLPSYTSDTLMFDDTAGLVGWGGRPPAAPIDGYREAAELQSNVQSIGGPMLLRYGLEMKRLEQEPVCVVRSEAQNGASIERLLPHGQAYKNLIAAVDGHVAIAGRLGGAAVVPIVVWCQGAANADTDAAIYARLMNDLFDQIGCDVCNRTGQKIAPRFLVVQPPGKGFGGAWPNLQAQVDVCAMRSDSTLVLSGWAMEQHDRIHFSAESAVFVGELCGLAANAVLHGRSWSTPYIAGTSRAGNRIQMEIGGPHRIVVDESINSPRHYVDGVPIAHYGFEVHGANIERVEVRSDNILIVVDTDAPVALSYAYHKGADRILPRKGKHNQSANRGTIRADWGAPSLLAGRTLRLWLASGTWQV